MAGTWLAKATPPSDDHTRILDSPMAIARAGTVRSKLRSGKVTQ